MKDNNKYSHTNPGEADDKEQTNVCKTSILDSMAHRVPIAAWWEKFLYHKSV